MRKTKGISPLGIGAVLIAVGCGGPVTLTEDKIPSWLRADALAASGLQLGVIEHHAEPQHFDVPGEFLVGTSGTVAITTYGGGCLARRGDVRVDIREAMAELIPLDSLVTPPGEGEVCTPALAIFEHEVELTFDAVGVVEIRLIGRRVPGDDILMESRLVRVVAR